MKPGKETQMQHFRFVVLGFVLSGLGLWGCAAPSDPPAHANVTLAPPPAPAPLRVTAIELGNALNAQKHVAQPTTKFSPGDTLYVSVVTEGTSPSATLGAKWTYGGTTLIKQDTQTIATTGSAATEFHAAKPGGWPSGKYRVEISVDGSPGGVKEFEVTS
jgi:hypothetical protein